MSETAKLFFSEDHEWVEIINDDYVRVGITEYAVEQLGDIVFVELPEVNDDLDAKAEFATVESVKSTSEIYSPVSGTIAKVNTILEDEPEKMNESPYNEGWLIEIQTDEPVDTSDLMDTDAYDNYTESL